MKIVLAAALLAATACTADANAPGARASATATEAAAPTCFGEKATIVGTDGDDTIHGTPHADVIVTGNGNDIVYGEGGDDRMCAQVTDYGDYLKKLYGGKGNDRINGSARADEIHGGSGADLINGKGSDDLIYDGSGDDYVDAGPGPLDRLIAGAGDDVLFGGDSAPYSSDSVSYENSPRGVVVDLQADTADGYGHDVVQHIWRVHGSPFDDVLKGTPREDYFFGGCGDDRMYGYVEHDRFYGNESGHACSATTDNDVMYGGAANDSFWGEYQQDSGRDQIYGGARDDNFYPRRGGENFDGGSGTDRVYARLIDYPANLHIDLEQGTYRIAARNGQVRHVENVIGSHGDDVIYGDGNANVLTGSYGNDELHGRGGDDELRGAGYIATHSSSTDTAYGGQGSDFCRAEVEHSCER